MNDTTLYQQILGLSAPWRVTGVTLHREAQRIEVAVACAEGEVWACPLCHQRMHVHAYERRRWRHLDSCQYRTFVIANVPRVQCPEHGTQTVQVPWAEKHSRFTLLFERLAIDLLLECSLRGACDILRVSWEGSNNARFAAAWRASPRGSCAGCVWTRKTPVPAWGL